VIPEGALVVRAREDPHDDLECRRLRDHDPVVIYGDNDARGAWRCSRCGVPLTTPTDDPEFLMAESMAYSGAPVRPNRADQLNRILVAGRAYRRYGRTPDEFPEARREEIA
jgi:hypothetical protein